MIYLWTYFCFMRLSYFTQRAFKVQTTSLFHENVAMRLIVTRRSNFFWFPLPSLITSTECLKQGTSRGLLLVCRVVSDTRCILHPAMNSKIQVVSRHRSFVWTTTSSDPNIRKNVYHAKWTRNVRIFRFIRMVRIDTWTAWGRCGWMHANYCSISLYVVHNGNSATNCGENQLWILLW